MVKKFKNLNKISLSIKSNDNAQLSENVYYSENKLVLSDNILKDLLGLEIVKINKFNGLKMLIENKLFSDKAISVLTDDELKKRYSYVNNLSNESRDFIKNIIQLAVDSNMVSKLFEKNLLTPEEISDDNHNIEDLREIQSIIKDAIDVKLNNG